MSVFDGHSGARLRTVTIGAQAGNSQGGAIAVDERRGRVVVTDSADSRVAVLDARSGLVRRIFTAGLDPTAVEIDPRSGLAYVADGSQSKILVFDPARGHVVRAFSVPHYPYDVTLDAGTGRLYVTGYDQSSRAVSGSMTVLDLRSGRTLASVTGAATAGVEMVAAPRGGAIYEVDFSTRQVFALDQHMRPARQVARWSAIAIPATWPRATTLDPSHGRLLILGYACSATSRPPVPLPAQAGCVRIINLRGRPSSHTVSVGNAPTALAVDPRTGRIFVANSQGGSAAGTGAATGWIPSWLRDHLPWLAPPTANTATGTASVIGGV